jgi:hypothetical protein
MTEPSLAAPEKTGTETSPLAQRHVTRWMQILSDDTPDPDESIADDPDDELDEAPPLGSGTLLTLSLFWLAAMMWTAHAEMVGSLDDAAIVLSSAALALPGTVAAALLAGAAAALLAVDRFAADGTRARRLVVGLSAGATCGAVAGTVIVLSYGNGSGVVTLAVTVGVAALVGGSVGVIPLPALAAGIAATLGVFAAGAVMTQFQSQIKALFGAGDTIDSLYWAERWYSFTRAALGGLVASAIAYVYLRRRGPWMGWPAYLFAGAAAGIMLLVAEVVTRIGGAGLLGLVSDFSPEDRDALVYLGGARIVNALVLGFIGGIAAMIAFGRTLRRPEEDLDDAPDDADIDVEDAGVEGEALDEAPDGAATAKP